jgi:hypothetical protein
MDRVDQCVSLFGGCCSSVAAMTRSTRSSLIIRGRPGRGSSLSPSSRASRKRDRHLPAVVLDTPSSEATALTELEQFALDPLVPQSWFSVASRSISAAISVLTGGRRMRLG